MVFFAAPAGWDGVVVFLRGAGQLGRRGCFFSRTDLAGTAWWFFFAGPAGWDGVVVFFAEPASWDGVVVFFAGRPGRDGVVVFFAGRPGPDGVLIFISRMCQKSTHRWLIFRLE